MTEPVYIACAGRRTGAQPFVIINSVEPEVIDVEPRETG